MIEPAEAPGAPSATTVDRDNPWPGPEAFREADAPYFFGRERPRVELSRLLLLNRLVILYGRSGLGKTSLLRAGVFPLLRDASTLPIYVRLAFQVSGDRPSLRDLRTQVKTAIERAAADAQVEAPELDPESTLWEWFFRSEARFFNKRSRRVRPILVFDQFEEAFTIGRTTPELTNVTDQFLDELADLVRGSIPAGVAERFARESATALDYSTDRDPCGVLLALRQEFLAELLRLRPRLPSLLDHRFELSGMKIEDAELVVTKPGGHLVEEGVAARIVAFVAAARRSSEDLTTDDTTVDPAILSIFCRELNAKRQALKMERITSELVAGAQDAIIADFYTRGTKDLGPEIHRFIEERLVTDSGYRNTAPLEDALRLPGVSPASIALLIERRLVRQEGVGPRARLELTHDVLTTPIVQSRNLRRLREQEEHARLAAEQDRDVEAKRQALRRQRISLVVLSAGLIVVGTLAFKIYAAQKVLESTLSSAHVEQGLGLIGAGRRDRGYAYVAAAVRVDPDNVSARSLALDALLHVNWPLPEIAARHGGTQWAQFDPTVTRLATTSDGATVDVWRVDDGQRIGQPLHHDQTVVLSQFGPEGRTLLTVARDGAARLWDVDTGQERRRLDSPPAAVQWAAFASTGDLIAVAGADGTVRLWRGAGSTAIKAHTDGVTIGAFDGRAERLATASDGRMVAVWDVRTGRPIARLPGHTDIIVSVQFSPRDPRQLLTASRDGTARLWDLTTGKAVSTIRHLAAVDSAVFSPDGSRILTTYGDRFAALWNAGTMTPVGQPVEHDKKIVSAAFSPEGQRVLTASLDQTARLWGASDGLSLVEPMTLDAPAATAVFTPDGLRAATATYDGTSMVWDVRTGEAIPTAFRAPCSVPVPRFRPDGRELVIVCPNGEIVFRNAAGEEVTSRQTLPFGDLNGLSFSKDGSLMVVVSSGTALVFRLHSAQPIATLKDDESAIHTAEMSSDGRAVLTVSFNGTRTWDALLGRGIAQFQGQPRSSHFSPDGTRVITISALDNVVRIWQRDGTPAGPSIQIGEGYLPNATLNADGTRLLTVSDRVKLWNARTGEVLADLPPARSAAFAPEGSVFHTTGTGTQIWDAETGHLLATLNGPAALATFSPNAERLIATDDSDYRSVFRLWDGRTGQQHSEARSWGYSGTVMATDPGGQRLLLVDNGRILIWEAPTGSSEDASVIADVLEAIVGYRVNPGGAVERLADRVDALRRARRAAEPRDGLGNRVQAWALGDRGTRNISPFSGVSIDQYIRLQIASQYPDDAREAQRLFPWDARIKPATTAGSSAAR